MYEQEIKQVCKLFGITTEQFYNGDRKRPVPTVRGAVYTALRKVPYSMTLTSIATMFNKHHSTVIHGLEMLKDDMFFDKEIRLKMLEVNRIFKTGSTPISFYEENGFRMKNELWQRHLRNNIILSITMTGYCYLINGDRAIPLSKLTAEEISGLITVLN